MYLVICEKHSVAQSISAVLGGTKNNNGYIIGGDLSGNRYIISWCIGHLLELAAPEVYNEKYAKWRREDLPIIPDVWKHTPIKNKTSQLKILTELMKLPDVNCIINACDAGREGELIFRLVYEHAKCTKPVKRLWISSMEDAAIKAGFENLRDGREYDSLYAAASCRECADFAVGLNATRLFSTLYDITLNAGRVQSPTLAMLVKRDAEIAFFVKEPFYIPTLDLGNLMAGGNKLKESVEAESIAAVCNGKSAKVTNVERVNKTIAPPKLYDITALQRDGNRLHGYTAQQTLEYTQSLYEKKLVSYPRTDSKFITSDMRDTVLNIIGYTDFTPDIDRIIGTVSDHYAIIPTVESRSADISTLPSGERAVFELIRNRLIAAVSPKHVYEEITVTIDCGGNIFISKGKKIITPGWKSKSNEEDGEDGNAELPELSIGQIFDSVSVIVKKGTTSPPKYYTEDTLLANMENAGACDEAKMNKTNESEKSVAERRGLGTPATRAAVIEKLIKSGFAERHGKKIIPTAKAKNLIAILPEALTSPKLTAEWEHKLKQVERGELSDKEFMNGIAEFTKAVVAENTVPKPEFQKLFDGIKKKNIKLGVCPRCGSDVRESVKLFLCDNKSCDFKLWKNSKFWTAKQKTLTADMVSSLLCVGRVALKDLYSERTGKKYDATVVLDDNGSGYVSFKLEF